MTKEPKSDVIGNIKGVHLFRQQAGVPRSRNPLKSELQLPCRIAEPRKWMAHFTTVSDIIYYLQINKSNSRLTCSYFLEEYL